LYVDTEFPDNGTPAAAAAAAGTEPKLKYYLEVSGADPEELKLTADRLEQAVADEVIQYKERGLTKPLEG
jgi:phosphoglucomutase